MKYKFNESKIKEAIKHIDQNPNLIKGRQSSTYDLVYNGKCYPPILVLSVANELNGGEELKISDFNNNTEKAFKILRDLGFKVERKEPEKNNYENDFREWALKNYAKKSNAPSSYITSLKWLSKKFYEKGKISEESIFSINDKGVIEELYFEVLKIQKDKSAYIYKEDAPAYAEKGFYSASLKAYKDFLIERKNKTNNANQNQESYYEFSLDELVNALINAKLIYSEKIVSRFSCSLLTKPFVILTGLSGSGKTKLAQAFVQWICASEEQYKIVPVGADWTNREPLLGYPNGLDDKSYVTPDSGVLHLIIEASKKENEDKPFFLILDEMNLSHVERYFADFLSIMESKDTIKLYSGSERKDSNGLTINKEIGWPKNLFIIGTVNIDETTYMFSPKVLDRANVIEFRITADQMKSFIGSSNSLDMDALFVDGKKENGGLGQNMAADFMEKAKDKVVNHEIENINILNDFFVHLQQVGAEFGYRSASEIELLLTKLKDSIEHKDDRIDIAIMQKLLPKLHGSRKKLSGPLETLAGLCLKEKAYGEDVNGRQAYKKYIEDTSSQDRKNEKIRFKLSFEKIERMLKNAIENGFTSYAEA
jgi:5-methylcytosine-specific restriction protein B